MYIDTHAHLYVEQFEQDSSEVVNRSKEAGVEAIFLPNIDLTTTEAMNHLANQYPNFLYPMMGLHPCSVKENYVKDLTVVESELEKGTYYGVGECGIDLYWDTSTKVWQEEAFERQIFMAKKHRLPIIIHSRSALELTIALVEKHAGDDLNGIFHCFDGTVEDAKRIEEVGFYLGIGGVLTYKKSHLPAVIKEIGLGRIVLETDAPYLSPVPKRGKRNESAYIIHTAAYLAGCLDVNIEEIGEKTSNNAIDVFKCLNVNSK